MADIARMIDRWMLSLQHPLTILSFFWAQVALFHALPSIYRHGIESNLHSAPLVLVSFICVFTPWIFGSWGIIPLVLTNVAYLVLKGSVSNHILFELCLCCSVITATLAAKLSSKGGDTVARTEYYLGECIRKQLAALYVVSAIHKMNSGFFDQKESCSNQVIAITIAQLAPASFAPLLTKLYIPVAPHVGIIIELFMGLGLYSNKVAIRRATIVLAQFFHLMLSIPLPPSSFYPFSAVCLLAYIPIQPRAFLSALRRHGNSLVYLCIACWPLLHWRGLGQTNTEYPPYAQYPLGVTWIIFLTLLNTVAALSPSPSDFGPPPGLESPSPAPASVMQLLVWVVGAMPYVGVRTYPAFAMFSNLRIETNSNHWFIPSWDKWLSASHATPVHILETSLPSLKAFQVDLSPYYPNATLAHLQAVGIRAALWVCPPSWPHSLPEEFQAFSIPKFELRRAISSFIPSGKSFFVRYEIDGEEQVVVRSINGKVKGDPELSEPISPWLGTLMRFRSFGAESDVCRH